MVEVNFHILWRRRLLNAYSDLFKRRMTPAHTFTQDFMSASKQYSLLAWYVDVKPKPVICRSVACCEHRSEAGRRIAHANSDEHQATYRSRHAAGPSQEADCP